MVWCQVALNWWDLRRPPLFILLILVFFRDFIKRDHLGFVFSCIFRREHGPRLSLRLTSLCVCAFLSWCHSQLRECQFLISCLLNHRPPDCAAKITSLFDEESLLVIFFSPWKQAYPVFYSCHVFLRLLLLLLHVIVTVYGARGSVGALQILLFCWMFTGTLQILSLRGRNMISENPRSHSGKGQAQPKAGLKSMFCATISSL